MSLNLPNKKFLRHINFALKVNECVTILKYEHKLTDNLKIKAFVMFLALLIKINYSKCLLVGLIVLHYRLFFLFNQQLLILML